MMRVAVAGCRGRMGAMLLDRFSRRGDLDPAGIDLPYDKAGVKAALAGARAVFLCVPAHAIGKTLQKLTPHMQPRTILSDITSVKQLPMQQMEALWQGPVVGTHPLFGPVQAEGLDLRTAIVPGKNAAEEDILLIESLIAALGSSTFRATAEEHDRAEARIQGMNFITTAVYFAMLAGDPSLLRYATPSFLRRMNAAQKQLMEDGPLFTWLFQANPHSQSMVRTYRNLLSLAAAGDIGLILDKAQWWWQDGEDRRQLHEDARRVALQTARDELKKRS